MSGAVKWTIAPPPLGRPNAELRPWEHLTERKVGKLIEAAKGNRWAQRDRTMLLIAIRQACGEPCRSFAAVMMICN